MCLRVTLCKVGVPTRIDTYLLLIRHLYQIIPKLMSNQGQVSILGTPTLRTLVLSPNYW